MNLSGDEAADLSASQTGYRFGNRVLLEEARTHPSAGGLAGPSANHNQRLEFLGDAVLGFLAAEHLFQIEPALAEGVMTTRRANLVRSPSLIRLAHRWDFPALLLLNEAEEKQGGRMREKALEDFVEAFFGAVYLDGGLEAARELFTRALPILEETDGGPDNPKGALQEWAHAQPDAMEVAYRVIDQQGPSHRRRFRVEVSVGPSLRSEGEGTSIKEAEVNAAIAALETLTGEENHSPAPPSNQTSGNRTAPHGGD